MSGEAIACVVSGREAQLAQDYVSVEFLLEIDAQSSNCGPCNLVLVKSSSQTIEGLVAELEANEGVIFAEPNYLAESQSEDVHDSWENDPEEPHTEEVTEEVEQQEDDLQKPQEEIVDQQESNPEEPPAEEIIELPEDDLEELQLEDDIDPQEVESLANDLDDATRPDYTDRQYAYNSEFGMGVPNWNTYDSAGNPTPSISAEGKVVAVLDSGVDYNHEDLRNAMWNEGKNYPALVALGGGEYGINVAMPRGDGTPYDTTDPMDDNGHGTHVAGIIAGEWNGFGVSGAASGAQIMAVKSIAT